LAEWYKGVISDTPCNPCSNGICGNCVAERLVQIEFIQNAGDHCKCAADGHSDKIITKELPNKAVFSKKKDDYTPPAEIREIDESDV